MKIKINSVYVLFVIGVISYLSIARSANPPNGRTGAPGDGLCIDCHSGGGTFDGETIITGLPDMIEPSTTYPITVTVTNPNGAASRAGFQLVALDNSNLNAGTFSNAGPDSDVENSGGRDYWEHRPAVFFPASNEVSWTIDWQAPASPPMEVITFYAAGLIANGSGAGNDRMELATASGTLGGMADPLVVTVSTTPAECFGDANGSATANVDGGTGPFSYSWSNGGNTQTISNLEAGNYSVTVTDMLMESDNDSDAVTEPSEIMTNVTITPVACNGESTGSIELGVSGGNNSFTFQWNNGANTEDLVNVPAGSYSVTITDMPNCQVILSNLDVTEPSMELSADFDISDVQCNGGADGEITANPSGGTPPYIYEWSTGSTDPTIEDLNEGTYSLTITDNNDCEAIFDVDIVQPMELTASIDIIDVRCNGEENGEIAVTPSGGTPPYLYAWSNGASTQNLTDIGPGSYNLTITDANNCTQEFTNNVVQEPAVLEAGADAMNESAPGANDGSASAFPAGGTSPYFYLWSNGENTETINNLPSGPYTVTVTDNKNCIAIETVVVQAGNCDIAVEVNTVDATCVDATNGSAAAIVTGGTSPFRYAWSTGDTTEMIDNLAPGNYSVTVTDAGNCIVVNSNSVNINDTESPVAMANDPTLYLDENGMASITGEMVNNESSDNCGGTNLSFTLETSSFDCSNLGENEVIFTAMDASGNADTDTITITVLDSLAPSLTCPGNIISTECNNITFATPTIGDNCSTTGTPMQTEGIASGEVFPIGETLITYTFMDDSNNPSSCSFTVTINSSLEINVDSIIGSSGANDGGINVSINGGSGNYTFEWMENDAIIANSEDLSNVGPGLYELKVIDETSSCILFSDTIRVPLSTSTIDPSLDQGISLFPNPANEFIQIENTSDIGNLEISIVGLDGKVSVNQIIQNRIEKVDVSNLNQGIYFVKIFNEDRFTIRKILIQ